MKILLATYWLVPHVGGVWTFMSQLKEQLEARGHEVDMMGKGPDYSKYHVANRGLELSKEKLLPLLLSKLNALQVPPSRLDRHRIIQMYELDRYCMELSAAYFGLERYDIIHTQDIFAARALSRVKPKGTPLVAHLHGSVATELHDHFRDRPQLGITERSAEWSYFNAIEHYGAVSSDVTITANEWQRNMLVSQFHVPERQITTFQYGLDAESFWRRARLGTPIARPEAKKVIIFPGRLVYVKGIHVLIDALHLLKRVNQDWVCWIVGDGEQRHELEQQVSRHALQNDVRFLGQRDDVPALLQQADIFVHSCMQDNQPFSVMEAQLAGLPVLLSSAAGLPEMAEHGRTGLISPVGDSSALCQQIRLLLENEPYRKELGANAKAWAAKHWSMELMIERLLEVYASVITKPD